MTSGPHLLTHNPHPNSASALHVTNMDVIPGQKCVRTDQINLGLLVAQYIQNVDGQKIYNEHYRKFQCVKKLIVNGKVLTNLCCALNK